MASSTTAKATIGLLPGAASSRNEKREQQRHANSKRRRDNQAARANELQSRWLNRDVLVAAAHELSRFEPALARRVRTAARSRAEGLGRRSTWRMGAAAALSASSRRAVRELQRRSIRWLRLLRRRHDRVPRPRRVPHSRWIVA